MGERKERPVFYGCDHSDPRVRDLMNVPGMQRVPGGLRCTWDAAWIIARHMGVPEPEVPMQDGLLPGLERYRHYKLNEKTRPYQKQDVLFLARRAWALLCEPMRSGKCLMALGADTLVDSRKTLIVGPAIAKPVWVDEIALWTGQPALWLTGRGGREARLHCLACSGAGTVDGRPCATCKQRNGQSYGYKIFDVPELVPISYRDKATGEIRFKDVGKVACTKHPDVLVKAIEGKRLLCGKCKEELLEAIRAARYVVVNYELLVRQHVDLGGGKLALRDDLTGWVDVLKEFAWDVLIADEAHMLRGWNTSMKRRGEGRNERLYQLADSAKRVWMVTGTPFFGFTRDIFWLLEIASGGLFGSDTRLKGRKFMERYCEGHKGQYGYEAKGRSVLAETELMRRLEGTRDAQDNLRFDGVWMKRSRDELFKDTPPIPKRVVRLDLEGVKPFLPGGNKKRKDLISKAILQNADLKREAILDSLMNELAEGNKIFVLCFRKASAKKTFVDLEQAILGARSTYRVRMREVNAKAWLATGPEQSGDELKEGNIELTKEQKDAWADTPDERYALAKTFRDHQGAAVIVATIDAMQVAISLRGASSVHFLDLHYNPGAIAQAEERPWYPEVRDLTIVYYVARGSVDDHLEAEVLPKVETLARLAREKGAQAMLDAFGHAEESRTIDAIFDRLTSHLRLDGTQGAGG
jgi:hypothetical protein